MLLVCSHYRPYSYRENPVSSSRTTSRYSSAIIDKLVNARTCERVCVIAESGSVSALGEAGPGTTLAQGGKLSSAQSH